MKKFLLLALLILSFSCLFISPIDPELVGTWDFTISSEPMGLQINEYSYEPYGEVTYLYIRSITFYSDNRVEITFLEKNYYIFGGQMYVRVPDGMGGFTYQLAIYPPFYVTYYGEWSADDGELSIFTSENVYQNYNINQTRRAGEINLSYDVDFSTLYLYVGTSTAFFSQYSLVY